MSIALRVWGPLACFTRPEMKAERVSYDVITPSAARGILEAIYWKPQIRWSISTIHVMNPVRFMSLRRNEVGNKIPAGNVAAAMKAGRGSLGLLADEDRQQRATLALRDVEYFIQARFDVLDLRESSGQALADPAAKHLRQFSDRARAGQCFHRPYLGCREFACDFELVEGSIPRSPLAGTPEGNRDLGYMLHDIDFAPDPKGALVARAKPTANAQGAEAPAWVNMSATARFFRAQMKDGVIAVPPFNAPEVRS
ncbi:MAG: type I-C CRISPR-associated protein Cas5 [Phycisphaerae bacterium]|nr:type I-C CRISPR-associated protein Cas5 [Phycisphaerae bacterium]